MGFDSSYISQGMSRNDQKWGHHSDGSRSVHTANTLIMPTLTNRSFGQDIQPVTPILHPTKTQVKKYRQKLVKREIQLKKIIKFLNNDRRAMHTC